MISIEKLTVAFGGIHPIHMLSVDLSTPIVGVVGPNGAGKTTLLNVLSGFVTPRTGKITAFGQDLLAMPAHQRARWGLRRTFQTEQVVEDLTVWDNVTLMLDTVDLTGHNRTSLIGSAIEYVGLAGSERRLGVSLNSFERRLTEIARALVGFPRIVLMDEPGAGLSEDESAAMQSIIVGAPDYCQAMVVLVDHDVNLIAATCASTAVLDFGELIAHGPTETVLADERVKAAYLGTEGLLS